MATLLEEYREEPHTCPYLPEQRAQLDVRVMVDVTVAELDHLLVRGWRRFGPVYFRPACTACQACESTRVPVRTFVPSRSQKRARRLASRLTRVVSTPIVDPERLHVYARWHAEREQERGWDASPMDTERYLFEFAFAHPAVREVSFRDPANDNRLVGLGIVDDVPSGLSAVYFFWDPERAPASLGVAHVIMLVEDAAARGLEHLYLGYRVEGCRSLEYKNRYQPQEILDGRPGDGAPAVWRVSPARQQAAVDSL